MDDSVDYEFEYDSDGVNNNGAGVDGGLVGDDTAVGITDHGVGDNVSVADSFPGSMLSTDAPEFVPSKHLQQQSQQHQSRFAVDPAALGGAPRPRFDMPKFLTFESLRDLYSKGFPKDLVPGTTVYFHPELVRQYEEAVTQFEASAQQEEEALVAQEQQIIQQQQQQQQQQMYQRPQRGMRSQRGDRFKPYGRGARGGADPRGGGRGGRTIGGGIANRLGGRNVDGNNDGNRDQQYQHHHHANDNNSQADVNTNTNGSHDTNQDHSHQSQESEERNAPQQDMRDVGMGTTDPNAAWVVISDLPVGTSRSQVVQLARQGCGGGRVLAVDVNSDTTARVAFSGRPTAIAFRRMRNLTDFEGARIAVSLDR